MVQSNEKKPILRDLRQCFHDECTIKKYGLHKAFGDSDENLFDDFHCTYCFLQCKIQ